MLVINSSKGQSVVINDPGMKQCFLDHYNTYLNFDSTLDQTAANNYSGQLECHGYHIQDISILNEFPRIWRLSLDSLYASDLSPLLQLDSVLHLIFHNSNIGVFPDLSQLTKLRLLDAQECQVSEFPKLSDTTFSVNLLGNQIQSINFDRSYPEMQVLMLNENQINSIDALDSIPNIKMLFIGDNNLETVSGLEVLDSLTHIHLYRNGLTQISGMENKTKLEVLDVRHNLLEELPALGSGTPTTYRIENNLLTFEDILPLFALDSFPENAGSYHLQKTQGTQDTITKDEGESFLWTLDFDQNELNNYYLWYKDGILIDSTLNNFIEFSVLDKDNSGYYHCEVKNTSIDSMTINVAQRYLEVEPFDYNKPIAFSPDGDGQSDHIYIEDSGIAQIFDEGGSLVNELAVPASWYGNDSNGNPLPLGYYIISINGSKVLQVTLVK